MNIVGTIMEVNPFHNGHRYFLKSLREDEPDSIIIVLVSTTLVQRGEVSVNSKKIKTKKLLENYADIVIEFPSIYSNQGGEYFASYAIKILNDLGIKSFYCGSESEDLAKIKNILNNEVKIKNRFKEGYLKDYLHDLKSNDILVLSYLKAIEKNKYPIEIKIIKRKENEYINKDKKYKILSATKIREKYQNNDSDLNLYIDNDVFEDFKILNDDVVKLILLNKLFTLDNEDFKEIFLSEKGKLIKRMKRICLENPSEKLSFKELLELFKDKNNSIYKYQRIIINLIFNIKNKDIRDVLEYDKYNLLGFSENGRKYLKTIKQKIFTSYKNKNELYLKNDQIDKFLTNVGYRNEYFFNYNKE